jgi:hypothetical protein
MIERIRGAMTGLRAKAQAQLRWFTSYTSTWLDATWPRIDFRRLVDDGYGKHAIVFACVQLYVRVMREPPLRVFDEDDEGERTPDLTHDVQALLRQPNAHMGELAVAVVHQPAEFNARPGRVQPRRGVAGEPPQLGLRLGTQARHGPTDALDHAASSATGARCTNHPAT